MNKKILRVYLDNCCYNRPYDDQSQIRISLEAQAKIFIQDAIKAGRIELAASYVLLHENNRNPHENRKQAIYKFIKQNTGIFVDIDQANIVEIKAEEITRTGVKSVDALHVACAIRVKCDYFLTTDDRLLKYRSNEIKMTNPIEFIKTLEGNNHE